MRSLMSPVHAIDVHLVQAETSATTRRADKEHVAEESVQSLLDTLKPYQSIVKIAGTCCGPASPNLFRRGLMETGHIRILLPKEGLIGDPQALIDEMQDTLST